MFVKFKANVNCSADEMQKYGIDYADGFEEGEIYEMTGDNARHWLDRGLCEICEKEEKEEKTKRTRRTKAEMEADKE